MICHASIGIKYPEETAPALAEILDGKVLQLPDQYLTLIVQMQDGSHLELWPDAIGFTSDPSSKQVSVESIQVEKTPSPFHLFVTTPKSPEEVLNIAKRTGWSSYIRNPNLPFSLIEVWVEGSILLQVCPEEWLPQYKATIERTRNLPSIAFRG